MFCAALLLGAPIGVLTAACSGGSITGGPCTHARDCTHGFQCGTDGLCVPVHSNLGQACTRESDCDAGQSCTLTTRDEDGDGFADSLHPTCQITAVGRAVGSACAADNECETGICSIGRCTELCAVSDECPQGDACTAQPRLLHDTTPLFRACLPATGIIETTIPADAITVTARIPVPQNAISVSIVSRVADHVQSVGVTHLEAPDGTVLYDRPDTDESFFTQPVRYQPDTEISTLELPNSSRVQLVAGAYLATIASYLPGGAAGTVIPEIHVSYRLGAPGVTFDANLYFGDLTGHACPGADISAMGADTDPRIQQEFLAGWRGAFAPAGLSLANVSYQDVGDHPDLAMIDADNVGALLALTATNSRPALNVFIVRSIHPTGVIGLSGGNPGPVEHGTAHSGIVLSADALCWMSWSELGRVAAHEAAHYFGLYHNREADGHTDPLTDSDQSSSNLMYFGDGAGIDLSPSQRTLLGRHPVIR